MGLALTNLMKFALKANAFGVIMLSNSHYAILRSFNQGHQFQYHSKARMLLPISQSYIFAILLSARVTCP